MTDSSVELAPADFVSSSRNAKDTATGPPRISDTAKMERIWKTYYDQMPNNWAGACQAISSGGGEQTEAQNLKPKVVRYLSLAPDRENPPETLFEDVVGLDELPRSILIDRYVKCRQVVDDLAETKQPQPPYVSLKNRAEQLVAVGLRHLLPLSINEQKAGSQQRCEAIMCDIAVRYNSVAYHHAGHAAIVMHHAVELARLSGIWKCMDYKEQMAFIYAAAGHDVGHPGKGSGLLMKTDHPLAILYNDKHILENYHAATLISLLRENQWDPLDRSFAASGNLRALIIQSILWTDILSHSRIFEAASQTLEEIRRIGKRGHTLVATIARKKAMLRDVLGMVLKAADLSYLALENPLDMIEWACRYYLELYSQREIEEEYHLPLCEPLGVAHMGGSKWFESNRKFSVDVVLPVAQYLSSIERRLRSENDEPVEAHGPVKLTSPASAVRIYKQARLENVDWTEVANELYHRDNNKKKPVVPPASSAAATAASSSLPSSDQGTVKTATASSLKWITKQANIIRHKAAMPDTHVYVAYQAPLERNIELLKKAKYLAHN